MLPFAGSCFGNPSSAHALGRTCKVAVDKARARLAALLGCTPEEIVFVASGSEADNHAIVAAVSAKRRKVMLDEENGVVMCTVRIDLSLQLLQ